MFQHCLGQQLIPNPEGASQCFSSREPFGSADSPPLLHTQLKTVPMCVEGHGLMKLTGLQNCLRVNVSIITKHEEKLYFSTHFIMFVSK